MKRKIVTILLFISILRAIANPLPVPRVEISELQFRADGSWILEIAVNSLWKGSIGAIWIKSNAGESKLTNFEDDGSYKLLVVENDNLTTPLIINPLQDNISVLCDPIGVDELEWWYAKPLTYGYPNSKIRTPKTGQSIAFHSQKGVYSITKLPSIGLENDTTGMMGTIKGIIYDKNGLPLVYKNNNGLLFGGAGTFIFHPQIDGSYSTRYYSRDNDDVFRLYYKIDYDGTWYDARIVTISISLQPDSVIIRDIYLIEDIPAGIDEINSDVESIFKIYPHPIKQQSLNYEISIPIKSLETYIIFRNINGQEIYRFLVIENKGVVVLPEYIKNGSYIVQLVSNKKNYATTKLIIQ